MIKKNENQNQVQSQNQGSNQVQNGNQCLNQGRNLIGGGRNQQSQFQYRDGQHVKSFHKGGWNKPAYQQSSVSKHNMAKIKTEETIDEIKEDIQRLEKEIEFEIKEIKSMRLGL